MSQQEQSKYAAKGAGFRYSEAYGKWKAVAVAGGAGTPAARHAAEAHAHRFAPQIFNPCWGKPCYFRKPEGKPYKGKKRREQ